MKIQHLISTMYRADFGFVDNMHIQHDALIVNQGVQAGSTTINKANVELKIINTAEKGLSNSRNMLLSNCTGDICIIGDDDLVYRDGYDSAIIQAYRDFPKADIIVFQFSEDALRNTRTHYSSPRKLGIFEISKVASVEITFKRDAVIGANIAFDSVLGLGAPIGSGEENAFLADALRKGLVIQYVPFTICYCLPDDTRTKWKDGFNENYLSLKGAAFYRIYGDLLWIFISAGFVLVKKRTLFSRMSLMRCFSSIFKGRSLYLKELCNYEN